MQGYIYVLRLLGNLSIYFFISNAAFIIVILLLLYRRKSLLTKRKRNWDPAAIASYLYEYNCIIKLI
jgi:hypothetical protein